MRMMLLASAAMFAAAPLSAQDQSAHGDHSGHSGHGERVEKAEQTAQTEAVDHCAMGHLPPEQCPTASAPQAEDHSGHGSMGHGSMDHSAMDHGAAPDKSARGAAPESAVPARAFDGPRHAADAIWGEAAMAPNRRQFHREHGDMRTGSVLIERLEARIAADGGEDGYVWDVQAFYGGDINRFVLKSEGEGQFGGALENAEIKALFSRAIGPFFDFQAGVRFDPEPDTRTHLVLGIQGLAPYMFHVDGAVFLSDRGDLTARIKGEYDQRITQHLILQPRIEAEFAAQDIPERRTGAGITKIEPGLRLRYEFVREFAPYIGIEYEAKLGETADIARAAGERANGVKLLAGVRAWF